VVRFLRHDLHTLTGAYSLDAIDGGERDRFEHHLHRCQSCEHEVRGMQETATRLGVAVARQPPPGLKVAVLAAAARTRQHPPPVEVRPLPEPRARWRPRLAVTVAALATAVAVVLGVTLGVQRSQLDQARAQQREVAAVLGAAGARIVTERTSLGGTATMVVSRRLNKMIFTASGLPALSDARVYQLWLMEPDGGAVSVGLLQLARGGQAAPVLADGPPTGDRVGLTVEPAGGTTKPTTTPIVALSLPS
jgi:anti-sigma-K factor RskA